MKKILATFLLFNTLTTSLFAHTTEKAFDADMLSQVQHIKKFHPEVIWVNAEEYSKNILKTKTNQKRGVL